MIDWINSKLIGIINKNYQNILFSTSTLNRSAGDAHTVCGRSGHFLGLRTFLFWIIKFRGRFNP